MKKIKINKILPIVAVVAALGAAIVPAHKSGAQSSTTQYYWFDATGTTYNNQNTLSDEIEATGCTLGGNSCARGYSVDQLNDPSNPSAGHKNVTPSQSLKN